jgi:hypothetical protein
MALIAISLFPSLLKPMLKQFQNIDPNSCQLFYKHYFTNFVMSIQFMKNNGIGIGGDIGNSSFEVAFLEFCRTGYKPFITAPICKIEFHERRKHENMKT